MTTTATDAPDVQVAAWSTKAATALVDGVQVHVERGPHRVVWLCSACGPQHETTCWHAQAFASTPVPNWNNTRSTK